MPTKTTDQVFYSWNELIPQAAWTCHIHSGLTGKELIRWDMPRFSQTNHFQTQMSVRSPSLYLKPLPFLHSTNIVHVSQHPLRVIWCLREGNNKNSRDTETKLAGRKTLLQPHLLGNLQSSLSPEAEAWLFCVYHPILPSQTFTFYMTSKFSQNHRKLKIRRDLQKSPSSTFCSKHSQLQNYTTLFTFWKS